MTKPWDRPPIPKRGDESIDITYNLIGRVMSQWESVEFELSRLYTWFAGNVDDPKIMDKYGEGRIFNSRIERLKNCADNFFVNNSDQTMEGCFEAIASEAKSYSFRRNDIAHGIAFRIDRITFFRNRIKPNLLTREHYAVIPPLYAFRFSDNEGYPLYAYTSVEMDRLDRRLSKLRKKIKGFWQN